MSPSDPWDRHYTPDDVALSVVRWMAVPSAWTVVEPSVGDGAWVRALRQAGHTGRIIGCDIDPDAAGLQLVDEAHVGDWTELAPRVAVGAGLVLGNPPFRWMVEHIEASLRVCRRLVTLAHPRLLEATQDRAPWLARRRPAFEWTFAERIRFGGPVGHTNTDSVCHTILFWRPDVVAGGWHRELVSVRHGIGPSRRIRWLP